MMELDKLWRIEKSGRGFVLIEKYKSEQKHKGKPTGKMVEKEKERYYGTVYQALQGYITHGMTLESPDRMISQVGELMLNIRQAKNKVREEYKIVRSSNG